MAFFDVSSSASNIPKSDVTGAGGLFDFAVGGTRTLYRGSGGVPVLVGAEQDPRSSNPSSNTAQQLSFDKVRVLDAAAYYATAFTTGVQGPLPWNAGAGSATNISDVVRYKVTSASGGSLTCVGPHPQRVGFGVPTLNPAFPAPGEPRWTITTVYGSIPIGAEVRPLGPSVLAGKMYGVITAINAPSTYSEEVTCTFTTTGDFDNIAEPRDKALGSFDAYVDVYFYRIAAPLVAPLAWSPVGQAWSGQVRDITRATDAPTLDGDGCFELTGPDGESRKALFPSMDSSGATTSAIASFLYLRADGTWVDASTSLASRWRQDKVGSDYRTRIYLDDLYALTGSDYVGRFYVTYYSQYLTGDTAFDLAAFRHPSSCANSRPFTGYTNAGTSESGQVCWAKEDATGFANGDYHVNCYLPGTSDGSTPLCDKFVARGLSASYVGGEVASPGLFDGGGDLWDRITVASDITFVEFYVPGAAVALFYVERVARGNPSLATLAGPWRPIDRGLFTIREPLTGPILGQRETYTDGDGNQRQVHVPGAFWKQAWSDDSGVQDAFDASDFGSAAKGVFPANVAYATKTPPTGVSYPPTVYGVDAYLPPHCGGQNQYTGDVIAANPGNRLISVTGSEKWALSLSTGDLEDSTLAAELDAHLVGL